MNVERNLFIGTIATVLVIALLIVVYMSEEARMYRETKAQQGHLIARGARLYDNYCAGCHGKRGEGGMAGLAPSLNVEDLWSGREDIAFYGTLHDYIALNISAGHPKLRMPSWADEYGGPLRNDQIEDLTQFVLNWMGQQPEGVRPEVTPTPMPTPTPTLIAEPTPMAAGDPAKGEQIFVTNCVACHGLDASGSELGPSLISPEVAAKDDASLRDAIANGRPGTSMLPWSSVLSPQDIEDIIAFLRSKQ